MCVLKQHVLIMILQLLNEQRRAFLCCSIQSEAAWVMQPTVKLQYIHEEYQNFLYIHVFDPVVANSDPVLY